MIKYLFNVFLRYTVVSVIPVSKKLESESFSVKHSDLYRTIILMIKKMHGDFGLAAIKTGFAGKPHYCNVIITK